MISKRNLLPGLALFALLSGSLTTGFAAGNDAYLTDNEGQLVHDSYGNCVHTGEWNDSMPSCPGEPSLAIENDQAMLFFTANDSEFFGFDQVKLSDTVKHDLDSLVGLVDDADLIHGITITGHADSIGSKAYNEKLALHRAQAVRDYLITKGIPAERILALSDGSSKPLVTCPSVIDKDTLIGCLSPNRRVDIQALLSDQVDIQTLIEKPVS